MANFPYHLVPGYTPKKPAGTLPDTSSLFNRPKSAEEMFPGHLSLPGKPCPTCDGSGVDFLAGYTESELRRECRGLEKSLSTAQRNANHFRNMYNDKSRAMELLQKATRNLEDDLFKAITRNEGYKRKLFHGSRLRAGVLLVTLLLGLILGQFSWSVEWSVGFCAVVAFFSINLRSAAEWSEKVELMREAEADGLEVR